jgi:hypothetical protein
MKDPSGQFLSLDLQRLLVSPGTQVALQECYGHNESLKALYTRFLIEQDIEMTKYGMAASLIGGGLVVGAVAKLGWATIAAGLRALGKSPAFISVAEKMTATAVTSAMAAGAVYSVHEQRQLINESEKDLADVMSCENTARLKEKLVDEDMEAIKQLRADFWQKALHDDLNALFKSYRQCRTQELNSEQTKVLNEKIKKYEQIRAEYVL